jgi:hypothetical protein
VAAVTKPTAPSQGVVANSPGTVTVTLGGWSTLTTLCLVTVASVATCGAAFLIVAAPALRAVTKSAQAAERASEAAEKAMEEFEKLSVQTSGDLPRTLGEMEKASVEWDAFARESREIIERLENWGQFSGADEALTKLTRDFTKGVLEEPSRAVATTMDEAESFIKSLTDDFALAVGRLADWESRLNDTVNQAAFKETWERVPMGDGKTEALKDVARAAVAARRREAVAEAVGVAEAATERARAAGAVSLDQKTSRNADGEESEAAAKAMAAQADAVATSLRNALLAVEEAKEAAADVAAFESFDEDAKVESTD